MDHMNPTLLQSHMTCTIIHGRHTTEEIPVTTYMSLNDFSNRWIGPPTTGSHRNHIQLCGRYTGHVDMSAGLLVQCNEPRFGNTLYVYAKANQHVKYFHLKICNISII